MAQDLAHSLLKAMAQDWLRFERFVLTASHADGGSAAALDCFDVKPGEYIRLALRQSGGDWRATPVSRPTARVCFPRAEWRR